MFRKYEKIHRLGKEETDGILKKVDFGALQRIAFKKSKQVFMDILHDSISVADQS